MVYNTAIPLHIVKMFETAVSAVVMAAASITAQTSCEILTKREGYMEHYIYEHRKRIFAGLHFLPIIYLIPDEIAETKRLADFPRDPYIAATEDKWWEVYHSKKFQSTLMESWAWMMWRHIGIKGGIDNYSVNHPIVRMVYDLGMWAWLLSEVEINTDMLAGLPHGEEILFLTMEKSAEYCDLFANLFWNHPMLKMREVWEIVKTHPAHDDYSNMPSHAKMDFHRRYYHTRAKTKVEPIVSGYGEDGEEEVVYAPYTPNEFADVEFRIWIEDFLKKLTGKDRRILKLLEEGYTQEEIGGMLGYANHSGVAKRVKFIRQAFIKFRKEQG